MSDVKKKLLEEISRKIKRRKAIKASIANKSVIDVFVQAFIKNIEDVSSMTHSGNDWVNLCSKALEALTGQLRSIDAHCNVNVSWHIQEDKLLQVNGVIISWSKNYQEQNNCDPELFIDSVSLLLN